MEKEGTERHLPWKVACAVFLFVLLLPGLSLSSDYAYLEVTPGYPVLLPDELHYREDFRVQWWYFTGHLESTSGREFGYEVTFFVVDVQKKEYASRFGLNRIYISHFAISDIESGLYYYSDEKDGGAFGFSGAATDRISVWVGNDRLEGDMKRLHLTASDGERSVDLTLVPEKPYVLNGEHGFSRKSEDDPLLASVYISNTNLRTVGTLQMGASSFSVEGKSWFDREISSRETMGSLEGWDWFAIQLDDGREIMLYLLRKKDGSIDDFSSGTFVNRNGRYRTLGKGEFSVHPLGHYRSRMTGARYPSGWVVEIPAEEMELTVNPLIQDQEFVAEYSTWNYYWEGACRVEGSAKGRAYVELTGYSGDR